MVGLRLEGNLVSVAVLPYYPKQGWGRGSPF